MTADFGSRGHVERPGVWGPRIALGVGCIVILFAAVIAAGAALSKATRDGSQMLGPTGLLDVTHDAGLPTLITIAVVWGLLYLFFIGPAGRQQGLKYFGVLAAVAITSVGLVLGGWGLAAPTVVAESQLKAAFAAHDKLLDADSDAYLAALGELGLRSRESFGSITRDLSGSERKVHAAEDVVARFELLQDRRADEIRARIKAIGPNPEAARRNLESFEEGYARARPVLLRHWALERRSLEARLDIIRLMQRTRGQWVTEGDNVMFYREGDLRQAQTLMREMSDISSARSQLQAEAASLDRSIGPARPVRRY